MNCRILYNFLIKRHAGHSKWANIRHIKAAKDTERSALFTKLSRQMKVAAQEGGSTNPSSNLRLSQVIEQARRVSMPTATIQNILKNMQQTKESGKPGLLEIKAPGGLIILCEIFTDNLQRTRQAISAVIKKTSFSFSDGGGRHFFEKKGLIEVPIAEEISDDVATEHAIETGAEDVKIFDDYVQFICDPYSLSEVQKNLEQHGYKILSADVEYVPKQCVQLPENNVDNLVALCDKLEGLEDVVKLYDNIM